MKLLLRILLLAVLILWGIGATLDYNNHNKAQIFVGIGVLILTLILMPLFIYHRYRKKDLSQYNIAKHQDKQ